MTDLSNFSENPVECHYKSIRIIVICFRQYPEKLIIWLMIKPVKELSIGPYMPLNGTDTDIPITYKTFYQ